MIVLKKCMIFEWFWSVAAEWHFQWNCAKNSKTGTKPYQKMNKTPWPSDKQNERNQTRKEKEKEI